MEWQSYLKKKSESLGVTMVCTPSPPFTELVGIKPPSTVRWFCCVGTVNHVKINNYRMYL